MRKGKVYYESCGKPAAAEGEIYAGESGWWVDVFKRPDRKTVRVFIPFGRVIAIEFYSKEESDR